MLLGQPLSITPLQSSSAPLQRSLELGQLHADAMQTRPLEPHARPAQSVSPQSMSPSQSLSDASEHTSSVSPPGQRRLPALHRRPRGPHVRALQSVSAQSMSPSQSVSAPSSQLTSDVPVGHAHTPPMQARPPIPHMSEAQFESRSR
jgi:hypothetical protein